MSRSPQEIHERQQRERLKFRVEEAEIAKMRHREQAVCSHLDARKSPNIGLQHNFSDRMVRGICLRCHAIMHPKHWDVMTPNGQATLVDAHPFYPVVLMVDAADAGRAILNDVADAAINSLMALSETRFLEALGQDIYSAQWAIQEALRCEVAIWLALREAK